MENRLKNGITPICDADALAGFGVVWYVCVCLCVYSQRWVFPGIQIRLPKVCHGTYLPVDGGFSETGSHKAGKMGCIV